MVDAKRRPAPGDGPAGPLQDRDVEDLYGVPLEGFMSSRAALVRRLKDEGHPEGAKAAASLRKPTVTAWVVNRLARRNPAEVAALLEANEGIRRAQEGAGRGTAGPRDFRAATGKRQQALARLTEAAREILVEAGHPDSRTTLDRVGATLLATAGDDRTADLVRRGLLTKDAEPGTGFEGLGFGDLGAVPPEPATKGADPPGRTDAFEPQRRAGLKRAASRAEALAAKADDAERTSRTLADEAEAARRLATQAGAAADRAAKSADRAADAAVLARRSAEEAAAALASLEAAR